MPRLAALIIIVSLAVMPAYSQSYPDVDANEAAAVGVLRTYNTACVMYAATYPEIGFPPKLDVLGTDETANVTPEHSGLMDATFTSPPYEKSGYRFTYRRMGMVEYTIVGRPVEFRKSGWLSFYTDQTAVIRSTEEDRMPTSDDPPLR